MHQMLRDFFSGVEPDEGRAAFGLLTYGLEYLFSSRDSQIRRSLLFNEQSVRFVVDVSYTWPDRRHRLQVLPSAFGEWRFDCSGCSTVFTHRDVATNFDRSIDIGQILAPMQPTHAALAWVLMLLGAGILVDYYGNKPSPNQSSQDPLMVDFPALLSVADPRNIAAVLRYVADDNPYPGVRSCVWRTVESARSLRRSRSSRTSEQMFDRRDRIEAARDLITAVIGVNRRVDSIEDWEHLVHAHYLA